MKENATNNKKERKSQKGANVYYTCRKRFAKNLAKDKNHHKVRDHYHYTGKYRGATYRICKLRFNVLNKNREFFTMVQIMIISLS